MCHIYIYIYYIKVRTYDNVKNTRTVIHECRVVDEMNPTCCCVFLFFLLVDI